MAEICSSLSATTWSRSQRSWMVSDLQSFNYCPLVVDHHFYIRTNTTIVPFGYTYSTFLVLTRASFDYQLCIYVYNKRDNSPLTNTRVTPVHIQLCILVRGRAAAHLWVNKITISIPSHMWEMRQEVLWVSYSILTMHRGTCKIRGVSLQFTTAQVLLYRDDSSSNMWPI